MPVSRFLNKQGTEKPQLTFQVLQQDLMAAATGISVACEAQPKQGSLPELTSQTLKIRIMVINYNNKYKYLLLNEKVHLFQ